MNCLSKSRPGTERYERLDCSFAEAVSELCKTDSKYCRDPDKQMTLDNVERFSLHKLLVAEPSCSPGDPAKPDSASPAPCSPKLFTEP